MFNGMVEHQLDDKNRLRIPSKFRKDLLGELGDKPYTFFRGKDGCIGVMSEETMKETFGPLSKNAVGAMNGIRRAILSSIATAEEDAQGRVVLPLSLRMEAGIKKDVVTIGVGNYIEIWAADRYAEHIATVDFDAELEDLGI
jgi:MraZ protein